MAAVPDLIIMGREVPEHLVPALSELLAVVEQATRERAAGVINLRLHLVNGGVREKTIGFEKKVP